MANVSIDTTVLRVRHRHARTHPVLFVLFARRDHERNDTDAQSQDSDNQSPGRKSGVVVIVIFDVPAKTTCNARMQARKLMIRFKNK